MHTKRTYLTVVSSLSTATPSAMSSKFRPSAQRADESTKSLLVWMDSTSFLIDMSLSSSPDS